MISNLKVVDNMYCDVCGRTGGHLPGCPEYDYKSKASHYCSVCDQPILDGEEYIMNDDGDCRHYDCFIGMRDLLQWLGYDIKTMEDE